MSLLQIDRLSKSFGSEVLFEPFAAQIAHGDRIALIGDNGVGKSTLLRILSGDESAFDGRVIFIGDVHVDLLPQTARLRDEGTLWTAMERPFSRLREIEAELRRLETALASSGDSELAHQYDELFHRFSQQGGYAIEAKIRSALAGVGFGEEDFDTPIGLLSGGEEARAALARVLLEGPDLLLLDEPTNHLDFAALDWLEETLASWSGALVLVSHDRHLLDRIANRTWEIAFRKVTAYRVGYSASRDLRAAERERRLDLFQRQQATIERYKDFVRRHKAGQKHRQAVDREKKLERIERERIEAPKDANRIALHIPIARRSGKRAVSLDRLTIGYDAPLFACPDLHLDRGEKVAVIGPNGCGKTTFLKTITGGIPPLSGTCELGHGIAIAAYSQTQEGLHGRETVLESILSRSSLAIGEARGLLGRFLFSGEDVDKRMEDLSGGERSRVALALLALMEGNLLLLDEPTNHLDLASQEILEAALIEYPGTLLLVSHDRALLEAVTTQVWIIEWGRLIVCSYGYAEQRRRANEALTVAEPPSPRRERAHLPTAEPVRPKKKDRYRLRQEQEKRRSIESAIEKQESSLAEIEAALVEASEHSDSARIAALGTEHRRVQTELETMYEEWKTLPTEAEEA